MSLTQMFQWIVSAGHFTVNYVQIIIQLHGINKRLPHHENSKSTPTQIPNRPHYRKSPFSRKINLALQWSHLLLHTKIQQTKVKGLVICFYLGWSGSILQFRQNIIKVGSKSWLLTCRSNINLSLPSYNGFALKRELIFATAILVCCIFGYISLISKQYSALIFTKLVDKFHLRQLISKELKSHQQAAPLHKYVVRFVLKTHYCRSS